MGFTFVMVKEHTGRAVELGNDNTLSTVDNEGTIFSHQGHFAHVDFLFFDVLDRLVGRFLVINDQADFHPQRRGVSNAPELTFLDVKNWLADSIAHILERGVARVTDNREYGFER